MKSLASLGQEVSITLPLESSSREARASQQLLQNVAAAVAVLGGRDKDRVIAATFGPPFFEWQQGVQLHQVASNLV